MKSNEWLFIESYKDLKKIPKDKGHFQIWEEHNDKLYFTLYSDNIRATTKEHLTKKGIALLLVL